MTTEIPVDVEALRDEIRRTYTDVSTEQEREFIFPTGRASAQELDYPEPSSAHPGRDGRELRRRGQPAGCSDASIPARSSSISAAVPAPTS
jgi:hypothetical protein